MASAAGALGSHPSRTSFMESHRRKPLARVARMEASSATMPLPVATVPAQAWVALSMFLKSCTKRAASSSDEATTGAPSSSNKSHSLLPERYMPSASA
jgi:hypothetical protein